MNQPMIWAAAATFAIAVPHANAVEFITNGDFEGTWAPAGASGPRDGMADTIPAGWTRYETFSGYGMEGSLIAPLTGNGPSAAGLTALLCSREWPQNGSGDMTTVMQPLAIPVADYQSLTLSLDVMVDWHDLQAGGWVNPAFEWPVTVWIHYLDVNNQPVWWRCGWYVDPPGDGSIVNDPGMLPWHPTYNDTRVQRGVWHSQSFNLLQEMPLAAKLNAIYVGGSGWRFKGSVDNVSLQGVRKPIEVQVDIKPGSDPNSINVKSHGVLPVAILTTGAFDATSVDPETVALVVEVVVGGESNRSIRSRAEDVDADGDTDLMLFFRTECLQALSPEVTNLGLVGATWDGTPVFGSDAARIIRNEPQGPKKK